jgi:hypothetical protein
MPLGQFSWLPHVYYSQPNPNTAVQPNPSGPVQPAPSPSTARAAEVGAAQTAIAADASHDYQGAAGLWHEAAIQAVRQDSMATAAGDPSIDPPLAPTLPLGETATPVRGRVRGALYQAHARKSLAIASGQAPVAEQAEPGSPIPWLVGGLAAMFVLWKWVF